MKYFKVSSKINNRVRITFIKTANSKLINKLFNYTNYYFPSINIKTCLFSTGFIITGFKHNSEIETVLSSIDKFFENPLELTIDKPPTEKELRIIYFKEKTISLMIFLSVIGFILPLIPGTPFLLIAWSLGWRPKENQETNSIVKVPSVNLAPEQLTSSHIP